MSPSYIVKQFILFGWGNAKWKLCKNDAKQSGVRYDKQNKHQLLYTITSVCTFNNLQYYFNVCFSHSISGPISLSFTQSLCFLSHTLETIWLINEKPIRQWQEEVIIKPFSWFGHTQDEKNSVEENKILIMQFVLQNALFCLTFESLNAMQMIGLWFVIEIKSQSNWKTNCDVFRDKEPFFLWLKESLRERDRFWRKVKSVAKSDLIVRGKTLVRKKVVIYTLMFTKESIDLS